MVLLKTGAMVTIFLIGIPNCAPFASTNGEVPFGCAYNYAISKCDNARINLISPSKILLLKKESLSYF